MKLNLGCGPDVRPGYVNVDMRPLHPDIQVTDLSKFPWPWADDSADQVMMLDFLEHFPYRKTEQVLQEAWRVLKMDGEIIVQVPDFEHCAKAALHEEPFLCNACGWEFKPLVFTQNDEALKCGRCGQEWFDIAQAAIHRLFGGQDHEGNFHYTAFTHTLLETTLLKNGFGDVTKLEKEHQYANWNIKFSAKKIANLWGDL